MTLPVRRVLPLAAGTLLAGLIAATAPIAALALMGIAAAATLAITRPVALRSTFLVGCAALLACYAFFGRTFAYLGVPPIYPGEGILLFATLVVVRRVRYLPLSVTSTAMIGFMFWGAIRTAPFVADYGIDSLRDAVVWGYATYALALSCSVGDVEIGHVVAGYRRLAPVFVWWFLLVEPVTLFFAPILPQVPGSLVPIFAFKGGDAAVHLAGIAAFFVVGLGTVRPAWRTATTALSMAAWVLSAGIVASINRGGLVAMAVATTATAILRPSTRVAFGLAVALLAILALIVIDPVVDVGGSRVLSPGQIAVNLSSLAADIDEAGLQGTKDFRLRWWADIIDYTIAGPYFWAGKGFGVNLADDDGFQVTADHSLREPHNGHLSILARMGVPGLLLWTLVQVSFGWSLIASIRRERAARNTFYFGVFAWLFAYWCAMLVNMSFDPYLEGPQGGIWFWSTIGFGIAAMRSRSRHAAT